MMFGEFYKMPDWILIQTNYPNKCVECRTPIDIGDSVYWKKGTGLKCYPECQNFGMPEEDKTQLIICDEQDEDFYLK